MTVESPQSGRIAAGAVLTGISQAIGMVAGGVLAVLVAVTVGNTDSTDGFFTAYAVYSLCVLFAQSARTTVVARMIDEGDAMDGFNRFLGGGLVVFMVLGVVLVGLGAPVADLITGTLSGEASQTARTALLLLWPAFAGQLFACLGAAALALRGSYGPPAFAFGAGGLLSIVLFLVLQPAMGVDALGVAILAGSIVTALVVAAALWRAGWRPASATFIDVVGNARRAGLLTIAAVSLLLTHFGYLATLTVAAHLGQGLVTEYTYAYSGILLITALLSTSAMVPLAGALAHSWDRRPASLLPHHLRVFSLGVLLLAPCVAAAALVGDEIGGLLLSRFSADEVRRTVGFFLVLSPGVVWAMALGLPETALYTLGRYRAAALRSVGIVLLHIAVCLVAERLDSVWLLASASTISAGASVLVLLGLVYGPMSPAVIRLLLACAGRVVGVAVVAWGIPALAGNLAGAGSIGDWAALLIGAALFTALVCLLLPAERGVAGDLIRSLRASAGASRAVRPVTL